MKLLLRLKLAKADFPDFGAEEILTMLDGGKGTVDWVFGVRFFSPHPHLLAFLPQLDDNI